MLKAGRSLTRPPRLPKHPGRLGGDQMIAQVPYAEEADRW